MTYKSITCRLLLLLMLVALVQCEGTRVKQTMRLNEIQFIGSHNSYKQAIEPALMAQLVADNPALAASLDYSHLPLAAQFDLGIRGVELDIFFDPQGGRFANPLGLSAVASKIPFDPEGVMQQPGFKVLHVQDIDFRSSCLLFSQCLAQIIAWSDGHPNHLPLFITINAKDDVIDRPGFVRPLKFNTAAWAALDEEIEMSLGNRLLTPDDVRGDRTSLREAVLSGWPEIDSIRGKVLFVLDDATAKKHLYMKDHPSLAGRAMFVDAPEDTPEASIRIVNDPVTRQSYIQDLVKQGFIVRTRADADTREARTGDKTRFAAALSSGAQIISTDYYVVDERLATGFVISLPGGGIARCNPVSTSRQCVLNDARD